MQRDGRVDRRSGWFGISARGRRTRQRESRLAGIPLGHSTRSISSKQLVIGVRELLGYLGTLRITVTVPQPGAPTQAHRALNVPPARVSAGLLRRLASKRYLGLARRQRAGTGYLLVAAPRSFPRSTPSTMGPHASQRSKFDGPVEASAVRGRSIDFLSRSAKRASPFSSFSSSSSSPSRQLGRETWHGRSRASTRCIRDTSPRATG